MQLVTQTMKALRERVTHQVVTKQTWLLPVVFPDLSFLFLPALHSLFPAGGRSVLTEQGRSILHLWAQGPRLTGVISPA